MLALPFVLSKPFVRHVYFAWPSHEHHDAGRIRRELQRPFVEQAIQRPFVEQAIVQPRRQSPESEALGGFTTQVHDAEVPMFARCPYAAGDSVGDRLQVGREALDSEKAA
jgi:hypothetical protein